MTAGVTGIEGAGGRGGASTAVTTAIPTGRLTAAGRESAAAHEKRRKRGTAAGVGIPLLAVGVAASGMKAGIAVGGGMEIRVLVSAMEPGGVAAAAGARGRRRATRNKKTAVISVPTARGPGHRRRRQEEGRGGERGTARGTRAIAAAGKKEREGKEETKKAIGTVVVRRTAAVAMVTAGMMTMTVGVTVGVRLLLTARRRREGVRRGAGATPETPEVERDTEGRQRGATRRAKLGATAAGAAVPGVMAAGRKKRRPAVAAPVVTLVEGSHRGVARLANQLLLLLLLPPLQLGMLRNRQQPRSKWRMVEDHRKRRLRRNRRRRRRRLLLRSF